MITTFSNACRVAAMALVAICLSSGCQPGGGSSHLGGPYEEGGTLSFRLDDTDLSVSITQALLIETDVDYPDEFEFSGNGFVISGKFPLIKDAEYERHGMQVYVNKPAEIDSENRGQPVTVDLPELGTVTIVGGTATFDEYRQGRGGTVDQCTGKIELTVKTDDGEKTLTGNFQTGIINVG